MEHPLIIGILNIVEDKLREFDISIPDDVRDETTTDPIVGYTYAELHDRIMEYLEEQGVLAFYEQKSFHPGVNQADAFIKAANHTYLNDSIPLSDIEFESTPSSGIDAEAVKGAVWELLDQFDNEIDIKSSEYQTAIQLTESLCFYKFPKLYDSIVCKSDYDLIFAKSEGEYSLFYYNPDSVSGGQIVECSFDMDDAKRILDGEPYIDVLAEHTQYLNDINTVHFFHTIFNLIEAKNDGMYLGNDILRVCHSIVNDKEFSGTSLNEMIQTAEQKTKMQPFRTAEQQKTLGGNDRE